jgi:hypothetical protein
MTRDSFFSPRLLVGWIAAAIITFAVSLYLMGSRDLGADATGPSSFSRSAIGYAGLAEVLQRLGIDVVKSREDSLDQLTLHSILVIAEPRPGPKTERIVRTLLDAETILLVLPKWTGRPSKQKPAWLGAAELLPSPEIEWALHLVAPQAEVLQVEKPEWHTNTFAIAPTIDAPIDLVRGTGLRPLIGGEDAMLLGELKKGERTIWILSDPDVMSNHGLPRGGNAALAAAMIERLRNGSGRVVFDETIHGFVGVPANPLALLFRFPFVIATLLGAVTVVLLLWASLGRFGAPQPAPPPLSAGRQTLLQNIAKLVEFTGHQEIMIRRYVLETVRDAGRQLHAPRGLSGDALVAWLARVGAARGVDVDCAAVIGEAERLTDGRRRSAPTLTLPRERGRGGRGVRLARDIYRWRGEIVDGRTRHPRGR